MMALCASSLRRISSSMKASSCVRRRSIMRLRRSAGGAQTRTRTTWLLRSRILSARESMISWCTTGTPSALATPAATSLPSEPISLVIATIGIACPPARCVLIVVFLVAADHRELDVRTAVMVVRREADEIAAGVEVPQPVERLHEALARGLGPGAAQRLDGRFGGDVGLERGERIFLLAELLLDRDLVLGDDRQRALRRRRHHRGDDHPGAVLAQLLGERARAREGVAGDLVAQTGLLRGSDEIGGRLVQGGEDDHVGLALCDRLHAAVDVRLGAILEGGSRDHREVALLERALDRGEVLAADDVVVVDDREALHAE